MLKQEKLTIVLAGQANVGKSVIFNYLTGLHQHVGNWTGKTVERAVGTLNYRGFSIDIVDLPGIYSFSTFSQEEVISRKYIAGHKPDFIVNIINGLNLERNLFFTLQLIELEQPLVIALNMADLWKEKGVAIDIKALEAILGVPVIPVEAIYNKGLTKVLDCGIELRKRKIVSKPLKYGKEVEEEIEKLAALIKKDEFIFPVRWLAIRLLEKDREIEKIVGQKNLLVIKAVKEAISRLEKIHGHDSCIVIGNERSNLVEAIVKKVLQLTKPFGKTWTEKLEDLSVHKIWGYFLMVFIFWLTFLTIFKFGNYFSSLIDKLTLSWQLSWQNLFGSLLLANLSWTAVQSIISLLQLAIPYIVPFYLILYFLEDWGYLARVAFLMDSFMHKIGIHGKACLPLLLGLGCNVPACLSCRILETERERLLTGILVTFTPCSAITIVILGLVGKFAGPYWAMALFLLNLLVIFIIGKILYKVLPGEATELIMEMPDYHKPHLKTIFKQTWHQLKGFIVIAGPLVILSGIIIQGLYFLGIFNFVTQILRPITVNWLGLPAIFGILLIFGILRKELILVMLTSIVGTNNYGLVLTFRQIITLGIVSLFYFPCIATFSSFKHEYGLKNSLLVAGFKISLALVLAGLASRIMG